MLLKSFELEEKLNEWLNQQGVFIGDPQERSYKQKTCSKSHLKLTSALFLKRKQQFSSPSRTSSEDGYSTSATISSGGSPLIIDPRQKFVEDGFFESE